MRVYILTEGGKNIGFGHIARCSALYDAFLEDNIEPLFIINGDDSVSKILGDRDYVIFDWLREKRKLLDIIQYANIGIVDSYLAPSFFYERFEKLVKLPLYIDDNKRVGYPRGIVLNGNIYGHNLEYPKRDDILYLLGPKYALLRKEFWDVPEKKIRTSPRQIMITFGGDDSRNLTPKVLQVLSQKFPDFLKVVIIGNAFGNIDEIKESKDENTIFVLSPDANKMKEVMLDSDIAISAGGQTLYEFARVGLSPIVIGIADNQKNNIAGWKKEGFIQYIGWWNEDSLLDRLILALEELISYDVRKRKSEIGRNLIDGKGALRVKDTLLSMV